MADNLTTQQRKYAMSRVRGQNTKPEKMVRSLLHRLGFRFRKNVKNLPGKPDVVLPKYRTAIFVNGCFWHGHENCKRATIPNTRREFWEQKISSNSSRDKKATELLQQSGWRVVTIWQCQLRNQRESEDLVRKIVTLLTTEYK
jgi:DNA mismatch endonuclease, patch repair protein